MLGKRKIERVSMQERFLNVYLVQSIDEKVFDGDQAAA